MKTDCFFVRTNGIYQKVALDQILYLETGSGQVQLVFQNQSMLIGGTLDKLLRMLPAASFCRIHESYAVAVEKVVSYDNFSVRVKSGRKNIELPLGKFHKKLLEEKIWVLGERTAPQKGPCKKRILNFL